MTIGRSGVLAICLVALVVAGAAIVVIASGAGGLLRSLTEGRLADRLPWGAFIAILILPVLAFVLAAFGARRAAGGTFAVQAAANRRNSFLLLVTLVGVVAATAEVIAVTVTFQPVPALWAAGVATIVGLGAAFCADRFGGDIVLRTANARPADPTRDQVLVNVVQELSLAAAIPAPQVFVIEDGSQNAFATGRDPAHASVAVTRGLLDRLDREQLQGVIGHELGHVRNLDTRYSLYVAVLVGLVALVTDGFLRTVLEGWRQGAFLWGGDADDIKGAVAAFVSGVAIGLVLLAVALLLRVVAPLFAAMVQAATSREREFLADTTSAELTRNPRALERALVSIATDTDPLETANRGTQHLWFRNPVKPGSDGVNGIFATHPSLAARVARLRHLQGLGPLDEATAPHDAN
jgi:heat shock protein HtpX